MMFHFCTEVSFINCVEHNLHFNKTNPRLASTRTDSAAWQKARHTSDSGSGVSVMQQTCFRKHGGLKQGSVLHTKGRAAEMLSGVICIDIYALCSATPLLRAGPGLLKAGLCLRWAVKPFGWWCTLLTGNVWWSHKVVRDVPADCCVLKCRAWGELCCWEKCTDCPCTLHLDED